MTKDTKQEFDESKFKPATQKLIRKVEDQVGHKLIFDFSKAKKADFLRHDQAQQYLRDGKLHVDVFDLTDPDYTVSHELYHFLLASQNIPQVAFNLTTGRRDLDLKLMTAGVELYDSVLHFTVYKQQKAAGFIDDQVKELYFKGILATLKKEPADAKRDGWMSYRLLTLLDAFIMFQGEADSILPKLKELYPEATVAAQKLYQMLAEKPLNNAFSIRKAVVKLYAMYDAQLSRWNLIGMHLNDFVTLTLVLSQHQQKLEVQQLFTIYHSQLKEKFQHGDGYIGRWKNDGQNSFVLPEPEKNSAATFRGIYSMNVADFLNQIGVVYLTR